MPSDKDDELELAETISEIEKLSLANLRIRWKTIFREDPPPAFGPDLLRRSIAYELQEQAYGGLEPNTRRILDRLIKALGEDPESKLDLPRRIQPGSELIREWKGNCHRVIVCDRGFEYEGTIYTNLSKIARKITNTQWNGPRFFGLRGSVEVGNKQKTTNNQQGNDQAILIRSFKTDAEEREILSAEIAATDKNYWGHIAVLGRTRSLLVPMLESLKAKGVRAILAQRRDRFISPQFVWLQACLDQALRPSDKQVFTMMVNAASRICDHSFDPEILIAEAEAAGQSYFEHWGLVAAASESDIARQLGQFSQQLAQSRVRWRNVVRDAIPILLKSVGSAEGVISDADDDRAAWDSCVKEIRAEKGGEPELAELVQGLALRSKEPPHDPTAVSVLTVHASKGLEFDSVYLIGLAESVMPSWQSIQKGVASAEMEEERRNCFVAITRTRERLVLSKAEKYRDWRKEPSRFLKEMGFT